MNTQFYPNNNQFQTPGYSRHSASSNQFGWSSLLTPDQRSWSFDDVVGAFTKELPTQTRMYLADVFYVLAECVGIATLAIGASFVAGPSSVNRYSTLFGICSLISFIWLTFFSSSTSSFMGFNLQRILLSTVAACTGLLTTAIVQVAWEVSPFTPFIALFATTVLFLSLTKFAVSHSRAYLIGLYSGIASLMGLLGLFSLMSYAFNVQVLPSFVWTALGLALFAFHMVLDIAHVAASYEANGPNLYVHAAMLFVDFAKLFVKVVHLLLKLQSKLNTQDDEERRRRNRRDL
eukprot:UN00311